MEKPCNCRWDGDTLMQQCTLHQAHLDTIHEWAEREALVARCKEHEQFRHQHRDCNQMGIKNHQLRKKLAELEGQTDSLLSTCHRLALELECLLLDTKDSASVSSWWDSAMAALDEWHKVKDSVSARLVPAEPLNTQLQSALECLTKEQ